MSGDHLSRDHNSIYRHKYIMHNFKTYYKITMYWKSTILIAESYEDGKTGRGCNQLKRLKSGYEPDPQKGSCMDVIGIGTGQKSKLCLCEVNLCNKSSSLKGGLVGTIIFALFMVL